jgi:diketogulonate reductase-like aldo/keto reductase
MSFHLLDRRQFGLRAAACLSLPALAALQRSALAAELRRYVKLPAGVAVPAVGQGAWHLGQDKHPEAVEKDALLTGIWLGMTLIDTSGNYGNGRSEEFIARVISERQQCVGSGRECIWLPARGDVYLVSKVESDEVDGDGIRRACDASLHRLQTDRLDLYLLHSPVPTEKLAHVVASFEQLRAAGKIRDWGVSNFNRQQMEDIYGVCRTACAV